MLMSVFTVTLIAFFVLTVWFEAPPDPVRRPRDQAAPEAEESSALNEAA